MDKVSSKKKKYIIIIVSVIALILCIGIVYLIVNKSKNKVNNNDLKSTSITSTTINAETTTHKPEKITIKVEDYIFSDIAENFKNINDVDYNKKSDNNITYEKDNDLVYVTATKGDFNISYYLMGTSISNAIKYVSSSTNAYLSMPNGTFTVWAVDTNGNTSTGYTFTKESGSCNMTGVSNATGAGTIDMCGIM